MSLPHRIGAAFCVISQPADPKEKLAYNHTISPTDKSESDKGLANEGDLTPAREGYGGGANAYFTAYPGWLVGKAQGTLYNKAQTDTLPVIEIKLIPYKNLRESKVIDNRSVPESYNYQYETLEEVLQGKGEFITVFEENFWEESASNPQSPLYGIKYPTYLPGVASGTTSEQFKEEKLWPENRFYPWGIKTLQPFDSTKADYLCSLRATSLDVSPLWIRQEPPDEQYQEWPPDSGEYIIVYNYIYESWNPSLTEEGQAYAEHYNTSTWKLRVKADQCCWNKGYKIKGRIKIAKRMLKFDPSYTDPTSGFLVRYGGESSGQGNYPFPPSAYFEGHRFVIDEGFAPDLDWETINWEIEINDATATGEWVDAEEIEIPMDTSGLAPEVTYICGFYVDAAEPPEPPV
jgi:hypothetical protein